VGPFGKGIGDVAADVVLKDCDGGEHSLHDLCGKDASWLYIYAEW
jgi:hypothetical protein